MQRYRRLLEEVRGMFPKANDVIITVLTTNEERIRFGTELIDYTKDGCCVMTLDGVEQIDVPALPDRDVSIQFDTTGKITVSNYEIDRVDAMLGKAPEDKEGDRSNPEPRY